MAQKYSEQPVTAAGGWVENSFGEVLWIHRLGQWDLPKGKLESGEAIDECAVREVEERVNARGEALIPLDDEQVRIAAGALVKQGLRHAAVALLHSYWLMLVQQ